VAPATGASKPLRRQALFDHNEFAVLSDSGPRATLLFARTFDFRPVGGVRLDDKYCAFFAAGFQFRNFRRINWTIDPENGFGRYQGLASGCPRGQRTVSALKNGASFILAATSFSAEMAFANSERLRHS
jgi:hypothetical protein